MRRLLMLCVFASVGLLASQLNTAEAGLVWSSSASVLSKDSGVIEFNNISNSAGDPDSTSWIVTTQPTSPPAQVKTMTAEWTFDDGVSGDQGFFGLFRYTNRANAVTVQVIGYTVGATFTSVTGTVATLPKISSPTLIPLAFTLPGASTTMDSVRVKFTFTGHGRYNLDAFGTPEPGTLALFGAGLLAMGFWARKRRRRKLA